MRFDVKALPGGGGSVVELPIEAIDRQDAAAQALSRGYQIISMRSKSAWPHALGRRKAAFPLVLFNQELLALLQAGLSLVEAIGTLAEKETRPDCERALRNVISALFEGNSLADSFAHSGAAFPLLYLSTVRASERTGALIEALERYIAYQKQMDSVKRHIVSASIYPAVLASVGVAVAIFLMLYVVPRFSRVYGDLGGELPWASRMLLSLGKFLGDHAFSLSAGIVAGVVIVIHLSRQPVARAWLLRRAWTVPAVGGRLRLFYLARLYRTIGMLLRGGMPIGTALSMAGGILQAAQREQLGRAAQHIEEGHSISRSMEEDGLTTPVALRMLRVGERTGKMGDMMERIAAFHEEELERWVEQFIRLFEPVLMIAIGALIGCIVVLMYLPIFDLAGSLR